MNKFIFFVIFSSILFIHCGSFKHTIECQIKVDQKSVYFDDCYNGLTINKLEVKSDSFSLYPSVYKKVGAIELSQRDNIESANVSKLNIFFNKRNENFEWKVYSCDDYNSLNCYFEGGNYIKKDTVNFFTPSTWYLFKFNNPHFEVFVYSDSIGIISFKKRSLNANF